MSCPYTFYFIVAISNLTSFQSSSSRICFIVYSGRESVFSIIDIKYDRLNQVQINHNYFLILFILSLSTLRLLQMLQQFSYAYSDNFFNTDKDELSLFLFQDSILLIGKVFIFEFNPFYLNKAADLLYYNAGSQSFLSDFALSFFRQGLYYRILRQPASSQRILFLIKNFQKSIQLKIAVFSDYILCFFIQQKSNYFLVLYSSYSFALLKEIINSASNSFFFWFAYFYSSLTLYLCQFQKILASLLYSCRCLAFFSYSLSNFS